MEQQIVIIDDEHAIVQNLKDYFEDYDFIVRTASNGKEGLLLLEEKRPDIVIVDLNMPGMDGYAFTREATRLFLNLPIIVLSGVGLVDEAMRAMRDGAWDFISKPVSDMQLVLHTVEKCLEKARLTYENDQYQKHLEVLVSQRTQQIKNTKKQIVHCLGKAAEFKDNETGHHVLRVAQMSYILACGMTLAPKFCRLIRDASPMHDVGKIGIVDRVLLKNGSLDPDEWEHMKQHVKFGCTILSANENESNDTSCSPQAILAQDSGSDLLTVARRIALFHHERWDGKGYLFGLAEEAIPVEARIVSLVDVYDAVSSKRPYKDPFPEEKCQNIIRHGSGSQFDPAIVEVFFNNLKEILMVKQQF